MNRPLARLRIAVTRVASQSEELALRLRALGAEPILFPLIEIIPPEDWSEVDAAIGSIADYDWIIFTSANAVHQFMSRLALGGSFSAKVKVAAIGPATEQALLAHGHEPEVVPERHVAESLVDAVRGQGIAGARILVAQGDLARELVAQELAEAGALVDAVVCYRNVPARPDPAALQARVMRDEIDWILLFSPSAVHNLFGLFEGDWCKHTRLASIGPTTTLAIREHGAAPAVEAAPHTTEALLDSMAEYEKEKR